MLSLWQIVAVILLAMGRGGTDTWGRYFTLGLSCDNLTLVLLMSIGIVTLTTILVGWQTIGGDKQRFGFMNLVFVAMIGMNGTVMLTDLFSLYIFIEVTAVASFILIAFQRDTNALEGAFKYIILSATATVMMLLSISIMLLVVGRHIVRGGRQRGAPIAGQSIGDSGNRPIYMRLVNQGRRSSVSRVAARGIFGSAGGGIGAAGGHRNQDIGHIRPDSADDLGIRE